MRQVKYYCDICWEQIELWESEQHNELCATHWAMHEKELPYLKTAQ